MSAQPGRGGDVANLLLEILGESLQHDGCEIIRILRDQAIRGSPLPVRHGRSGYQGRSDSTIAAP